MIPEHKLLDIAHVTELCRQARIAVPANMDNALVRYCAQMRAQAILGGKVVGRPAHKADAHITVRQHQAPLSIAIDLKKRAAGDA